MYHQLHPVDGRLTLREINIGAQYDLNPERKTNTNGFIDTERKEAGFNYTH